MGANNQVEMFCKIEIITGVLVKNEGASMQLELVVVIVRLH